MGVRNSTLHYIIKLREKKIQLFYFFSSQLKASYCGIFGTRDQFGYKL